MLRYGTIQGDGRVKVGAYGNFCNWNTWHDFYSPHHIHPFFSSIYVLFSILILHLLRTTVHT